MLSTDKVFALVEALQNLDDAELVRTFPIASSPTLARIALATAASKIPTDPAELDGLLDAGIRFLGGLRSDMALLEPPAVSS